MKPPRYSNGQRAVRDAFKSSVACFRAQPRAGGVIPPAVGTRSRPWWYAAAEASGLWYFDYFMQQTIPAFLAHNTPDWCKCGQGWSVGSNLLIQDNYFPMYADTVYHNVFYNIVGFHNFDGEFYRKHKFLAAFDVGSILWKNASSCKITLNPAHLYDGTIFFRIQVSVIYNFDNYAVSTWNNLTERAVYLTTFTPVHGVSPTFYVGDAWKKCQKSGIMVLLFEPEMWTNPGIGKETYAHFLLDGFGRIGKFEPCY